jgi:hypothetical protein
MDDGSVVQLNTLPDGGYFWSPIQPLPDTVAAAKLQNAKAQ